MTQQRFQHLIRQDCPVPPGTHAVVYLRDSGGEEQDRSVQQQLDVVREYCDLHNLVIEAVYRDDSRLSSNIDKRDQFQLMIRGLKDRFRAIHDRYKRQEAAVKKPFAVIVWKGNRLGRDNIEVTHVKAELRLRGVTIIELVTSANTGNVGIDALIEALQQYQDEVLLDELSSNVKRGQASVVSLRDDDPDFRAHNPDWESTGAYLGIFFGEPPRGFKKVPVVVGKHKRGQAKGTPRVLQRLVPDEATWHKAYRAWEMRHNGATMGEVHRETRLYDGVSGYSRFFSNLIYVGDYVFGGITHHQYVPQLIPRAWFDEEQVRIAERRARRQGEQTSRQMEPAVRGSRNLLSGLVYCGAVPGEEHIASYESVPAKPGKRGVYRFLQCNVAKRSHKKLCPAGRINARALESTIIDALMADILTVDNLRPIAQKAAEALERYNEDATERLKPLRDELLEVRQAISNIMDAIERMGYARHLQERYDTKRRREEELSVEIETLQKIGKAASPKAMLSDAQLGAWVEHLRASLTGNDVRAARPLIQSIIEKVVVREGHATLYYTFPLPGDTTVPSIQVVRPEARAVNTRYNITVMIPQSATTASKRRNPDKAALREQVIELRSHGHTWDEIGARVGLSAVQVSRIARRK